MWCVAVCCSVLQCVAVWHASTICRSYSLSLTNHTHAHQTRISRRGTWLIHMYTYITSFVHMWRDSFMWHDSFILSHTREPRTHTPGIDLSVRDMTHLFVYIFDMTHSHMMWLTHMWHSSFICDMFHMQHDVFIHDSCVTWLIHTCNHLFILVMHMLWGGYD